MVTNHEKVLVVDDEVENVKALERTLRGQFEVTCCISAKEAFTRVQKEDFLVVISDQRMPEMLGTDLLAQIASTRPLTTRVILTGYTETREILDAINRAHIYRYVTKPWDNLELISVVQQAAEYSRLKRQNNRLIRELEIKNQNLLAKEQDLTTLNQNLEKIVSQKTTELRHANEKLSELAMTDPLTGIMNRRAFFGRFEIEIERSKRYVHSLAVAMIDVDHFKPFNDREGHLLGDEALRKVAQLLSSSIRKTDLLCRYGGEEFALFMPETEVGKGYEICERLRLAVVNNKFQGRNSQVCLTISIGLAGFPLDGTNSNQLIEAADKALYSAKQSGRNKVTCQTK
ncbi:MAG: diguanylate cyclase [Deltaproteobacteria bacterium]|nr:diguanylate cyclase [Deltaproteobacteria bacterium]